MNNIAKLEVNDELCCSRLYYQLSEYVGVKEAFEKTNNLNVLPCHMPDIGLTDIIGVVKKIECKILKSTQLEILEVAVFWKLIKASFKMAINNDTLFHHNACFAGTETPDGIRTITNVNHIIVEPLYKENNK